MLNVGDTVRHSGYALQSDRDYWQGLGDYTRKERAKENYMAKVAERGAVTALLPREKYGITNIDLEITWNDGHVSRCFAYMVIPA
jgi:hypothetical protein